MTASGKRKALGRGLDALLPVREKPSADAGQATLPLDSIDPNPDQPRRRIDAAGLESLAESLRRRGLVQPVVVRPSRAGRYQIVAGERRWRAARLAGLSEIPVVVRKAADDEALELALVENLHREDLGPLDAAEGYQHLIDGYGYSQDQVATAVGKSRPAVANTLRLLGLPEAVKKLVMDSTLSEGHARAVLLAEGASRQVQVAREAARRGLSVRETERLARSAPRSSSPRPAPSPEVRDLEDQLRRSLGTKVQVVHSKAGKGSLRIHYGSLDELDRILDVILGRRRR